MALDRLVPLSTTVGAVAGDTYMDAVGEEITGLWDRSVITLSAVSGTDTITATVTPALTAGLLHGMFFLLKPVATNTTAVTLNGTAVRDGENTALTAGALRVGGSYLLKYDSAATAYLIVGYHPAAQPPGQVLIKTQAASASGTIDFVNGVSNVVFDDTYDSYLIDIASVRPATDDVELWLRIGTGAGPTYQTANYKWVTSMRNTSGAIDRASASDSKIILAGGSGASAAPGNASAENGRFTVRCSNPEGSSLAMEIDYSGAFIDANGVQAMVAGGASYQAGTAITALRFMYESGNITVGRFTLYGLRKS
jgi:hypothetical protein